MVLTSYTRQQSRGFRWVKIIEFESTKELIFDRNINPDLYLYHYTSAEVLLRHILPEKKLRFSPLRYMNDPRESKDWSFTLVCPSEIPENEQFIDIRKQATMIAKSSYKILCFTQDDLHIINDPIDYNFLRGYGHPRMWAQYAKNHTGACIIFDKERLNYSISQDLTRKGKLYSGPVIYNNFCEKDEIHAFELNFDEIRKKSLNSAIDKHIEQHHQRLYFSKASDWSGEIEYRWLFRGVDSSYEYVSIESSIKAVILGEDFELMKHERDLVDLCRPLNIDISRILWRNGKPELLPVS